jgi:hypothetical protein
MSLPTDPWYARLLSEAMQRPAFCTVWLGLVLAAVVGLAYVVGPWTAAVLGAGGITSLGARLAGQSRQRQRSEPLPGE